MSAHLPKSVEKVIEEFQKLPGIGPKSAARMAYHYLRSPYNDATKLSVALKEMEEKVVYCAKCFNIAESEVCAICSHPLRNVAQLCLVEEPLDISAFENSGVYSGLYFVLGGVISPAEGIGPEELRFPQLKARLEDLLKSGGEKVKDGIEVIIATNPSLEGEATSSYIADFLKSYVKNGKVKLTRLAMGLPTGADVEYADRLTLKRAMDGRGVV